MEGDWLTAQEDAEWLAGYVAGWLDTDYWLPAPYWFEVGRRCGASDFEGWAAGWRDYYAGIHAPRVERDDPDLEALWKEGYAAAFRTSPDAYQTEMRQGLKSWLALNVGEEAIRDLKTDAPALSRRRG